MMPIRPVVSIPRRSWTHSISVAGGRHRQRYPHHVVFLGDSVTYGLNPQGYPYPKPYPKRTIDSLREDRREEECGLNYTVCAFGGAHIQSLPPNPFLLSPPWQRLLLMLGTHRLSVDVVVFFMGLNDAFYHSGGSRGDWSSEKQRRLLAGLGNFTAIFQQWGAAVIYIPPLHFSPKKFSSSNSQRSHVLQQHIIPTLQKWAKDHMWRVLEAGKTLDIRSDYFDGVHPTEEGHEKIAQQLVPVLREI